MPKVTKFNPTAEKAFPLFNKNSFFDNCINCPGAFDRACIYTIEFGLEAVVPSPAGALRMIMKIINEMEEDKKPDLAINTFTLRNCYFYLILMMDYCHDDMQLLMMIQMTALQIFQIYSNNLDTLYKTDYYTLVDELDRCATFQSSSNCGTPNILKENFLDTSKTNEIKDYVKAKFIDVDFTEDMDQEEMLELEGDMVENDKMMEKFMNQMVAQLEELEKSEKSSSKKVKSKSMVKKTPVKKAK
jgi:hypothetical protein